MKLALRNATHDTTKCNLLLQIVESPDETEWEKYNENLRLIAEKKLKELQPSSPQNKIFKKFLAYSLNNIGYDFNQKGNTEKALEYYNKCMKMWEEADNKKGAATTLNNIGLIYHTQGNIDQAINFYTKSFKLQEEIGDKHGMAYTLNNLGYIYNSQGSISKALDFYNKSLKLREEIGDKKGVSYSLTNLGFIYQSQGDISKALDYYRKSLKLQEETGDKKAIGYSLNNIGDAYRSEGDYKNALYYYGKSLKIREEIGDKQGIAYSLNNIGYIYKTQGDPSITTSKEDALKAGIIKALDYYIKSLKLREEIQDKTGMATSLLSIGSIYIKQKNYPTALDYCSKAMNVSKELGYPENIKSSAYSLCKIYKATGNHKLALENYELFIQMRDSINNIETQKATIKQQTQYEYDKKKAVEDEKHAAELKVQEEKAYADKKRQNIIIGSVSVVLLLVAIFSLLLYNRFKTTQKQKQIIEIKEKETQQQKHIIEEKQKEILDSINYAKRIQYTLLAHEEFLKENLPEHFTYFNPKDIVSGDFYWATKHNNKFYLAVCDSTGHGVPGAFMSLLNIGFLTEAINEKNIEKPNEVFDYVRQKLTNTISKEGQKDGFDGILVCFDQNNKSITYAAANNAPVLMKAALRQAEGPVADLVEAPADRMPVGVGERKENFTLHTIDAKPGDMLYLYTDGYADQFGGPKGKKFKYKQLNELLVSLHTQPLSEQRTKLISAFNSWKGELEQVDDVCVIGIRL